MTPRLGILQYSNLLVIFLLGLNGLGVGLGVGQNSPPFPPPSALLALGRSVVNLGVYFLAGFLGVAPALLVSVVVLSTEPCFFLVLRV